MRFKKFLSRKSQVDWVNRKYESIKVQWDPSFLIGLPVAGMIIFVYYTVFPSAGVWSLLGIIPIGYSVGVLLVFTLFEVCRFMSIKLSKLRSWLYEQLLD